MAWQDSHRSYTLYKARRLSDDRHDMGYLPGLRSRTVSTGMVHDPGGDGCASLRLGWAWWMQEPAHRRMTVPRYCRQRIATGELFDVEVRPTSRVMVGVE
jgi:hypothetical protein